jgi:hypothetical protein
MKLKQNNGSFVFHTLSAHISDKGLIDLQVQISPDDKQRIDLAQLNVQQYRISSIDVQDEQIDILFKAKNLRLTIQHEQIEQKKYAF